VGKEGFPDPTLHKQARQVELHKHNVHHQNLQQSEMKVFTAFKR
jgi:hypothetical protein